MTTFIFVNNLNTTLASPVSSGATTITLSSTANLPATIPAGEVLVITLSDVATRQNFEVVYATARTGATLTVLRGQEGTSALSWLTGDYAFGPPTAGQQASFGQLAAPNTWGGANTFADPVVIAPGVTSDEAVNLGQFPFTAASPGSAGFPSGLIMQVGQSNLVATAAGLTTDVVNLPSPFPNASLFAIACFGGNTPPANSSPAALVLNASQIQLTLNAPNAGTYLLSYLVWGH